MGHSEHEWIGASWKLNTGGGFSPGEVLIIPGKDQNEGRLGWFWMAHGFAWKESLLSHSLTSEVFLLSGGDPRSCSVCCPGVVFAGARSAQDMPAGHRGNCTWCPETSVRIPDLLSPLGKRSDSSRGVFGSRAHEWPSSVLGEPLTPRSPASPLNCSPLCHRLPVWQHDSLYASEG